MAEGIESLRVLQKLDAEIFSLKRETERRPANLARQDRDVQEAQAALDEVKENIKQLQRRVDERNVSLKSAEDAITKMEAQAQTLKTNEEFTTMQRQIAAKKDEIGDLEEKVLEGMEVLDKAREDVPGREDELKQRQAELEGARKEVADTVAEIEAKISTLEGRWEEQSGAVSKDLLRRYVELRGRYQDKAMVELTPEGICQGCYMSVTSQDLNSALAGHAAECRNCQRIMWVE